MRIHKLTLICIDKAGVRDWSQRGGTGGKETECKTGKTRWRENMDREERNGKETTVHYNQ